MSNKGKRKDARPEMVSHPAHYNSNPSGVECIDIVRHYCFSVGSAMKYLWRAGLKHEASLTDRQKEIEDLKKAVFYIQDRISQLENKKDKKWTRKKTGFNV